MNYHRCTAVLLLLICLPWFSPSALPDTTAPHPPIDINTATAALLAEQLPGIGPVKALAIVAYRERFGLFTSVDALIEVRGIGPRTLERLRPLVQVGERSGAAAARVDPERAARAAVRAALRMARRASVTLERAQGVHPHAQRLHTFTSAERR